jgi:hypothetical protein
VVKELEERTISTTDDTDFTDKVMKAPVGVASSHDRRGKMPLPQKKTQLHWKVTTCAIIIAL